MHTFLSIGCVWESIIVVQGIFYHLPSAWEEGGLDISHCPPINPFLDLWKNFPNLVSPLFVCLSCFRVLEKETMAHDLKGRLKNTDTVIMKGIK